MKLHSLIRLDHLGLIRVAGSDAKDFLQRQLTNDMNKVSVRNYVSSAYLTPSGRVLANFFVIQSTDEYLLVTSADLLDMLSKRLRMFVLRSSVDVEVATDLSLFGQFGDTPHSKNQWPSPETLPQNPGDVVTSEDYTVFHLLGSPKRFGFILSVSAMKMIEFPTASSVEWNLCDIRNGYPLVQASTSEMFTSQAINLDLTNSVSFTKGCFPGQEILARLHYRGRVNRRTIRGFANTSDIPSPGTSVYCSAFQNQEGTVVNSVSGEAQGTSEVLVSVPLKFIEHQPLIIDNSIQLQVMADGLNYALPELNE